MSETTTKSRQKTIFVYEKLGVNICPNIFSIAFTLHCVHHDKWIFISQMRVLNTQKVYDIWYIDVDFAIIKFIDETVLFNSSLCIRGHKLSLCVLEFGLTKLAIHYLGFQLVIYCHRSLTDPLSICHISLRLQLVNHTSLPLHVIISIEKILNSSICYSKNYLWYCHLISSRHVGYITYSFSFVRSSFILKMEPGVSILPYVTRRVYGHVRTTALDIVIIRFKILFIYLYKIINIKLFQKNDILVVIFVGKQSYKHRRKPRPIMYDPLPRIRELRGLRTVAWDADVYETFAETHPYPRMYIQKWS